MYRITKGNLSLLLSTMPDDYILRIEDIELLFSHFGDEYFFEDGELVKTHDNEKMERIRRRVLTNENL